MSGTERPSTLMGAGWRPRARSHRDEIAGICGVASEVAPLRDVLLAWPPDSLAYDEPPGAWLMDERPDLPKIRRQAEAVAAAYEAEGIRVHWIRGDAPPNVIFARDLFAMTPDGAVVARMAAEQRAGEERAAAAALAAMGVPIVATPRGKATLEGADVLWMGGRVLVGTGRRTNAAGAQAVRNAVDVEVVEVEVPETAQHLLGALVPLREDLVLTVNATPGIRAALGDVREIALDSMEVRERRAANLVTMRPGVVIMPAGCPETRGVLEGEGIRCVEVDVSEYVKAAGALGCLTGIVCRA